jgi:hypothetical protein
LLSRERLKGREERKQKIVREMKEQGEGNRKLNFGEIFRGRNLELEDQREREAK